MNPNLIVVPDIQGVYTTKPVRVDEFNVEGLLLECSIMTESEDGKRERGPSKILIMEHNLSLIENAIRAWRKREDKKFHEACRRPPEPVKARL